jgi:hypothetical protein
MVQPLHIPYAFSGASASLAAFKGGLFVAWKESTNLNKLLFASTTFPNNGRPHIVGRSPHAPLLGLC